MSRDRKAARRERAEQLAATERLYQLLREMKPYRSNPKMRLAQVFDNPSNTTSKPFDNLALMIRQFKNDRVKGFSEVKLRRLCEVLVDKNLLTFFEDPDLLRGVFMVSIHLSKVIRNIEDWKPKSHNRVRQLSEMVHYLFAQYPMPRFFDSAYSLKDPLYLAWFIHVAQGKSVRKFKQLPVPMTTKMAHIFMQTPPQYSVIEAIRYAQIIANGGDGHLVNAVIASRMVEDFENNAFWETVFRFFIQNPMLDKAEVAPLIDYIHHVRFVLRPTPEFTMKGRTPAVLLRQMHAWHEGLNRQNRQLGKYSDDSKWVGLPMRDFVYEEGTDESKRKKYTIVQLRSAKALLEEGSAMHHCVFSYTHSCMSGRTSIWSLKEELYGNVSRLLTIEMNNAERMVVQVRGKYNRYPTEQEMKVVDRWMAKELIKISKWAALI
ncbi:MAG: PcfJ domain-containing protein [Saprospiraceae bacterium]|nr:PcfJ domain-containing protein [Saprospiraceae bacterium]